MDPLHSLIKEIAQSSAVPSGISSGICSGHYSGITADSRQVKENSVFVAIHGESSDGHRFISDALQRGAAKVICEVLSDSSSKSLLGDPRIIQVKDSRLALAQLAQAFFCYPSQKLLTIGVTGTNGKTSVAWILSEALALDNLPTAHLGTLGCRVKMAGDDGAFAELNNTTPDILITCEFLADALKRDAKACVMEVSSHALVQQRTRGMAWNGAIFTNLTRDHLDFHGTMEDYRAAKERLFAVELAESDKSSRFFVANIDDPAGIEFAAYCEQNLSEITVIRVSAECRATNQTDASTTVADLQVVAVNYRATGTDIELLVYGKRCELHSRLLGEYNVSNMLSALGALLGAGLGVDKSLELLSRVPPVPGRLELVQPHDIRVFVDYAHTPDALTRAQLSLKAITPGRLITVFGCGGNRDRGKRPLMARAVQDVADVAVVTSDNPRNEKPEEIVAEAVQGFDSGDLEIVVEVDRRQAIKRAIQMAGAGDSILIAGKGHEPYQEVKGVKYPFSDRLVAREMLAELPRTRP